MPNRHRAPASATATPGRRERNKQEKLDRIMAAATELFVEHGVNEVTTQQIADLADIGTGTLFLYARTKGELLLMVQNSRYVHALAAGRESSAHLEDPVDAVMAVLRPIIECNRSHIENGRTYLRELVFGDPSEPHHAAALEIVLETTQLLVDTLKRTAHVSDAEAVVLTEFVNARIFMVMAGSGPEVATTSVLDEVTHNVATLLHGQRATRVRGDGLP